MPLDKADESLEIMEKLTRNVVSNPGEEKFRKIKLTNKKINDTITAVPGAVPALREMGWRDNSSDGEPVLVLPAGVRLEFQETVVKLIEAKDFYKKEHEKERRQRHRDERDAEDPEKLKLRLQLEQDKKERDAAAANAAPTRSSQAQKLGGGPNIMRAGDIGIGKSQGG
jgi:UBX domain-containing protein 6